MSYREARLGSFGTVVSSYRNSEGELASVERVRGGDHVDELVLCFYDEDSPVVAPMLLDQGTCNWLIGQLLEREAADEKRATR